MERRLLERMRKTPARFTYGRESGATISPKTIAETLKVLKAGFKAARAELGYKNIKQDLWLFTPTWLRAALKREGNAEKRSFTKHQVTATLSAARHPEVVKVFPHCSTRDHAICATAYYTGKRPGETLGLRWKDVDFDKGVISVYQQKTRRLDLVPLVSKLAMILREHRLEMAKKFDTDPGDLVFQNSEGGLVDLHNWNDRTWKKIRAQAGLPSGLLFKHFRHTEGTNVYAEALKKAADALGHADGSKVAGMHYVNQQADAALAERRRLLEAATSLPDVAA